MHADELRARQTPLKERYKSDPASALQTMTVHGELRQDKVTCVVKTPRGPIEAGLHPSTGGTGEFACSGDMLLEALIGCAGVTLAAVATAMNIPIRAGKLRAEGDLDFRGTLGVAKDVDIGFKEIRLFIDLDTDAPPEQVETLIKLTKRYCVIYQTLQKTPNMTTVCNRM
ncbi:MAG TPA: OsmC family protein [Gemmataceae bacterium]|nr:OsmC family protein [Gemmataceae bacterium]